MAITVGDNLTRAVREAGRDTCEGFVCEREARYYRREDGTLATRVYVTVRTCYPLEGFGPPDRVELVWPVDRPPLLGEKVTIRLVLAWRWKRLISELFSLDGPDTGGHCFPVHSDRVIVEGDWELV